MIDVCRGADVADAVLQVKEGLGFLDVLFFSSHRRDTYGGIPVSEVAPDRDSLNLRSTGGRIIARTTRLAPFPLSSRSRSSACPPSRQAGFRLLDIARPSCGS